MPAPPIATAETCINMKSVVCNRPSTIVGTSGVGRSERRSTSMAANNATTAIAVRSAANRMGPESTSASLIATQL